MSIFGGGPSYKPPPPPPPPKPVPLVDEEEERRLAIRRSDLERRRTGRKSLVISPDAGLGGSGASGLRIPRGE